MRKCPFCSEEIQNEAIKCKHCHEWLTSKSLKNSFESLADSLKSWKSQIDEFKTKHLFEPKDDKPIIINECKFYESYLDVFTDAECSYDDIKWIIFSNKEESLNGIRTKKDIFFRFYVSLFGNDGEHLGGQIDLSYQKGPTLVKDKTYETLKFLYQYLAARTFNSRLNWELGNLKEDGTVNIGNYLLDNLGNILDDDNNIICNFIESFNKGLVEYGSKIWSSHSYSSYDPYTIKIYKTKSTKVKLFGIDFNSNIKINNVSNKDVVDFLLNTLLTNGKILD